MARNRRRTKFSDLVFMVLAGAFIYYIFADQVSALAWGLLAIAAIMTWMSLFMPTYCDVETVRGGGCRRGVYGKLRACRTHARDKRDAVFALFSLRNPGILFRVMWSDGSASGSRIGDSTQAQLTSRRAAYDVAMLFVAVVSACAGVLALLR